MLIWTSFVTRTVSRPKHSGVTCLLTLVLLSVFPIAGFGQSISSAEAQFIIGPQVPVSSSWFDTIQVGKARLHGEAFPATPPPPEQLDPYILAHYYDLGLTEYIAHVRTGDPAFLTYARKVCDSWWLGPYIRGGTVRNFDSAGPAPRHAGIGGLALRAMDGRPEMWDWLNAYTRYHFDVWLKRRINNSQLYYGIREGAFALHYATWLAKVLPDSFPLQAGGTQTNGASLREQYLADIEAVAANYYGRLQYADGSWRWDDIDFRDSDGGTLKGIMQPFMVGLLLNALIDVHRLSTNTTVKANIQNQITKACRHLFEGGPYRRNEPVPADPNKRWRSFWYFYHGGTTVNPTKYQNGGGSYPGTQLWEVKSERQSISTIFSAYGYAYLLTGDPAFKAMGDELFDSAFGDLTDTIRNEADGTPKNYNQNYRMGARYLVWRAAGSSPSPTPTPSATPTPSPAPTASPTPSPSPSVSPTPTPTPTPSPTPIPRTGAGVRKAKKRGQDLSNQIASASLTATETNIAVEMLVSSREVLTIFISEIIESQNLFNSERQIFPAANRIEAQLIYSLQCALDADSSLLQGDTVGARTHLRDAIKHLEISDALISYGNIANPIDTPSYLVRQHYVDFLDREPDQAGQDFWVSQISNCGTNQECIEVNRIHVSAAFFLSLEFQQTGYFVYRLYKSSFGRMPARAELLPDTRTVAQGLIVGLPGWEATLAASRESFLQNWVQRSDFQARYSRLTNTQYVDSLIANLGVPFSSSERLRLLRDLANGVSRATVLGRLVEHQAFSGAEFNSAFVLMQYVGYLGRDPDGAGFYYWLDKLNQFGGDYGRAELVRAFLTSTEYRNRFRL